MNLLEHIGEMRRAISIAINNQDFELWLNKMFEILASVSQRVLTHKDYNGKKDTKGTRRIDEIDKELEVCQNALESYYTSLNNKTTVHMDTREVYRTTFGIYMKAYRSLNNLLWDYKFMFPEYLVKTSDEEITEDFEGL